MKSTEPHFFQNTERTQINRHTTEALGAKEISASKWDDK
jgi:hypothetical protein